MTASCSVGLGRRRQKRPHRNQLYRKEMRSQLLPPRKRSPEKNPSARLLLPMRRTVSLLRNDAAPDIAVNPQTMIQIPWLSKREGNRTMMQHISKTWKTTLLNRSGQYEGALTKELIDRHRSRLMLQRSRYRLQIRPIIRRNKEMRRGASNGSRRSSLNNRGRRASSLIDSGKSNGMMVYAITLNCG